MERSDRWLSLILRTALLGLFVWMVKGLLIPLVLGGLLALLLEPVGRRLVRRFGRLRRFAPSVLTVGTVVLIVVPLVLLVIQVIASMNRFVRRDWSATLEGVQAFFTSRTRGLTDTFGLQVEDVRNYLTDLVQQAGAALAGFAGSMAAALPESIIDVFLFVLALYSFLRDGEALTRWLARHSPFPPGQTSELFASIRETVNGAVLGVLATALVQGILTTLALVLFSVPGALLLGVLATLLSMVPLLGTTPVTVGAAIYLLVIGRLGAALGMLAAAFVVGISDNIVRPWVQSSRGRMHPLLALISIFGGVQVLGFAGIFIGPVTAAIALWAIDIYVAPGPRGARRCPEPEEPGPGPANVESRPTLE
jgi:predicted PurR-regulated permease PerM